jgi:hypothetical protein
LYTLRNWGNGDPFCGLASQQVRFNILAVYNSSDVDPFSTFGGYLLFAVGCEVLSSAVVNTSPELDNDNHTVVVKQIKASS